MFKVGDYVIRKETLPGAGSIAQIQELGFQMGEPSVKARLVFKSKPYMRDTVNWYISRVEKVTPLHLFLAGIEESSDEL